MSDGRRRMSHFGPLNVLKGKPCRLTMQELRLVGRVTPQGARLVIRHVFESGERMPVEVIYPFMLPRDAALRRFRVKGSGFEVTSELVPAAQAEERYETGIEAGGLATIVRQFSGGMVNLAVGNVRPGERVEVLLELLCGVDADDEGYRFRFPFTIAPLYHRRARCVPTPDGGLEMSLDDDHIMSGAAPLSWDSDPRHVHRVGFSLAVAGDSRITEVSSPSHPLRVQPVDADTLMASLAGEGAVPDRDLVLQVRYREPSPRAIAGIARDGHGWLAVTVPSSTFGRAVGVPRRLVVLVDRSGSMGGRPLSMALQAVRVCLASLSPDDQFALASFAQTTTLASPQLVPADARGRAEAEAFLQTIVAGGGTHLESALQDVLPLLDGHGEIFLITDGQVAETRSILQRVHGTNVSVTCLGIGDASQDRFLSQLAEATGGLSRMIATGERIDDAAVDLFGACGSVVAEALELRAVGGGRLLVRPDLPTRVYAGRPLTVLASNRGGLPSELELSWRTPQGWQSRRIAVQVAEGDTGETLKLLQGARLLSRFPTRRWQAGPGGETGGADPSEHRVMTELSREFGLASEAMALVAVHQRQGEPDVRLPITRVVPQFGSLLKHRLNFSAEIQALRFNAPQVQRKISVPTLFGDDSTQDRIDNLSMSLCAEIEADGGMPGSDLTERLLRSLVVLLYLEKFHRESKSRRFGRHQERLEQFLTGDLAAGAPADLRDLIVRVIERVKVKAGDLPAGRWGQMCRQWGKPTPQRLASIRSRLQAAL